MTLNADTTLHLDDKRTTTAVHGKILWKGDTPPHLGVGLGNEANGMYHSVIIHPDGTFEVPALSPAVIGSGSRAAKTSTWPKVEVKGATYADGELEVGQGAQIELLLTAGRGLAKIEGYVVQNKNPVPGAMVLLIPQDKAHGQAIARDQSDGDGSFTLSSVAPGRYTLVAIDHGRGLAYADPSVIAPYLEHGQVLNVPLAQSTPVQTEAQTRR